MEKEFVPYDLALRLEALGFDEEYILACYDKDGNPYDAWARGFEKILDQSTSVLAPTFSQAFRWFREKYNLIAEFNWHFPSKCYATSIYPNDFYLQTKSYEQAELACLDKLIEIIESKSE